MMHKNPTKLEQDLIDSSTPLEPAITGKIDEFDLGDGLTRIIKVVRGLHTSPGKIMMQVDVEVTDSMGDIDDVTYDTLEHVQYDNLICQSRWEQILASG
jgi:hypothetical protein